MSYKCKKCNKVFKRNEYLQYHITNNSCKKNSHFYRFCNKGFTTLTSMYRHMRSNCAVKKQEDIERDLIYERLIKLEKDNKKLLELEESNKKVVNENKKLKKQVANMEKRLNSAPKIGTIKNLSINNGTMNTVNNIMLVGYGKEDMLKMDKAEILNPFRILNYLDSRLSLSRIPSIFVIFDDSFL